MTDDTRVLRDRQAAAGAAFDRSLAGGPPPGVKRMLVQVYDGGAIPSTQDHYFACHPAGLGCPEAEGTPCAPVVDTSTTILVDFIRNAPQAGDLAVAFAVGGRWVAELGSGAHSHSGCNPTTICVVGCDGSTPVPGASVSIESGGQTIASGVTGSPLGCVALSIPAAGSYTVVVSATGYYGYSGVKSLACGGPSTTIALQPDTAPTSVAFAVTGCCNNPSTNLPLPLAGATITLSDGQSCTTDSTGANCQFWIGANGTYTYTISKARFADATGSIVVGGCGASTRNVSVAMTPASGYVCGATGPDGPHADPIPTTLHLTDSAFGGCVLTYDAASNGWTGQITGASWPGDCNCPATTFSLYYGVVACSSANVINCQWDYSGYGSCYKGTFTAITAYCPETGALNGCGSASGNQWVNQSLTPGEYAFAVGGTDWTLDSAVPYHATGTIPPMACPGAFNYFYPWLLNGATITITE